MLYAFQKCEHFLFSSTGLIFIKLSNVSGLFGAPCITRNPRFFEILTKNFKRVEVVQGFTKFFQSRTAYSFFIAPCTTWLLKNLFCSNVPVIITTTPLNVNKTQFIASIATASSPLINPGYNFTHSTSKIMSRLS